MSNKCYSILFFILGLAGLGPAAAQGETYIRAGQLVDVVDGRLRSNQTIVIRGDRIQRVAASSSIDIPAGADVIDLSN
jgi:imidazolonepropionase-like amidohydrolase